MRTLLLCAVLAVSGCGAIGFEVAQDLPEQQVPGSVLPNVLPSFLASPMSLNVDLKAETQKRGTGPATHVYMKSLTLKITPHDKPTGNFDFLTSVHIFIESPSASLPKVEIAHLDKVPSKATSIDLTIVPDVDLLPYVNAGSDISGTASGTQPSSDVTYDGRLIIDVRI